MSFIRGAVITIFGLVLSICIILMNLSLSIALSLQYEDFKPALQNSASGLMSSFLEGEEIFDEELMRNYCLIENEYILGYGNQTFAIPCEIIKQGKNSIINYVSGNFVDQIYYTKYDCEFWECVETSEVPFVFISDKAREYWLGMSLLLIALSLVLFVLIFMVAENRPGKFIGTGILIILSALPLRSLNLFSKFIPVEFLSIFSLFSEKANSLFIIMLVLGILFIGVGIISKIFGWKMRFNEDKSEEKKQVKDSNFKGVSKSEVRQIVREELSKKNNVKTNSKKKN